MMNKKIPPDTKRLCLVCEKITKWRYNPKITHSECKECGCRNIRGD